jgi:hypothetical protein
MTSQCPAIHEKNMLTWHKIVLSKLIPSNNTDSIILKFNYLSIDIDFYMFCEKNTQVYIICYTVLRDKCDEFHYAYINGQFI